jgi:hypothetical protein
MSGTSCSEIIEGRLASSAAFDSWRSTTDATLTQLAVGTATPTALNTLTEKESDILQTTLCLQRKLAGLGTMADSVSAKQEEILRLQQRIQDQEKMVEIAKDRVKYTRDSDRPVSFYESWFPIGRPMKPIMIPVLFGIALFFAVFFFMLFLSSMGFFFSVRVLETPYFEIFMGYLDRLGLTLPFWIVLAVLIGLTVYYFRNRG